MNLSRIINFALRISPIFYKLVFLSVTACAVGFILLILRMVLDKKISPVWKYFMWILVVAALIIPYRFESRVSLIGKTEISQIQDFSYQSAIDKGTENFTDYYESDKDYSEQRNEYIIKSRIFDMALPLIYLAGAITGFSFILISVIRLKGKIKTLALNYDLTEYYNILSECKKALNIKHDVKITVQKYIKSPALYGVFKPEIVLPEYTCKLSCENVKYIFLHELSHLKRHDNIINYLLLALRSIYWFNPVIWILFRFIRQDMELANDSYVIRNIENTENKNYSLSLVAVLCEYNSFRFLPNLLCMSDSGKNIERRIKMIQLNGFFKSKKVLISGFCLALTAIIGVLFLTIGKENKIPELYIRAGENVLTAKLGEYHWNNGKEEIIADSIPVYQFKYNDYAQTDSLGIIMMEGNSKIPVNDCKISIYSPGGNHVSKNFTEAAITGNGKFALSIPSMTEAGEYYYEVIISYKYGTVTYGFKALVIESPEIPVWLTIQNFSSTGLSFVLYNENNIKYIYDEPYELFKSTNGTWEPVPLLNKDTSFNSISYILNKNTSTEKILIDWTENYGKIADGKYRFYKSVFTDSGEEIRLYDEFELINGKPIAPVSYTITKKSKDGKIILSKEFKDKKSMAVISKNILMPICLSVYEPEISLKNVNEFYFIETVYSNNEKSADIFFFKGYKAYHTRNNISLSIVSGTPLQKSVLQEMTQLLE